MTYAYEIQLASWCDDGLYPPYWTKGGVRRSCTREGRFVVTGAFMGEVACHLDDLGVEYTQIRTLGPIPMSLAKQEATHA